MSQAPSRLDLGGCHVTLVDGGCLRLDGGAMFGIVPKPLWSRLIAPDEQNRIQLACNCLLVEFPGSAQRVIIETGHGPKYNAKEQGIFAIDPDHWLGPSLKRMGVEPDTITDVMLSHLHFDHAGGLTYSEDGRARPTFPNARVHVTRREFDDARADFAIMRNTYREENFAPLEDISAWVLHPGDCDLISAADGVRVASWATPGHTRGHQSVVVAGRDATVVFAGDLLPTRHHVGQPYNMALDLMPLDNCASKRELFRGASERDWIIAIPHELETPFMRARPDGKWFRLMSSEEAGHGADRDREPALRYTP
jgi:glyoxylase-like metal-dependent hydrolase (beta-lactamase superfamily II)